MADQISETSPTTADHSNNWPSTKLPADNDVSDDVSNGQETHSFADILSTAFTATGPVPSPPANTDSNMQLGELNFVSEGPNYHLYFGFKNFILRGTVFSHNYNIQFTSILKPSEKIFICVVAFISII